MTRIALIAHDDEKPEMIDLAEFEATLSGLTSSGPARRGRSWQKRASQSSARVRAARRRHADRRGSREGRMDGVVFLRDPLTAQPHEPDISALLRICDVHDVPLATTRASADYILEGLAHDRADGSSAVDTATSSSQRTSVAPRTRWGPFPDCWKASSRNAQASQVPQAGSSSR